MNTMWKNPFVPQPPTYMPPPQIYQGQRVPAVPSPTNEYFTQGSTNVSVPVERTERQKGQLFKIAFLSTVGFFILSHHVVYRVVNSLWSAFTGKTHEITCEMGCPTTKGVFLHSIIYFLYMMVLLFA